MVEYIKCLFVLLLAVSAIKCENCVKYDFESNFDNSFNNGNPVCAGMAVWSMGNYSTINIQSPNEETDLFITPDDSLSCVSSYVFEMRSTGIVEVYVYMESTSQQDQIIVLANEVSSSENAVVTGTAILTPLDTNYFNGWHVLRVDLFGTEIFSGYVTFLGVAAPESKVIVDSFRYIPPLFDDDCHVYDGDFVTSQPEVTEPEQCVAYNFETDFDSLFNNNRGPCTGYTSWNLNQYTSSPIENPSSESLQFISPQNVLSCVSSFPFEANNNGVVEVNVYIESADMSDQITVLVNQIEDEANDNVIADAGVSPLVENYADGWHVLRVVIPTRGRFKGYISLLGTASEESTVLVDSFRYIPPGLANEECNIYQEEVVFQSTTPAPTTVAPIGTGEDCVTYNFETDFEKSFDTDNVLCNGYSSWHLGDYHSLAIETIDPHSSTFIAPNETSSCISSFVFRMMPGGVVNVNAYMKSESNLDYIIILAKKRVPSGEDTVAGFQLYHASNANFVEGWNVLKVTVTDFSVFDGYITLLGSSAETSIILIDSFSYTPPNSSDTCEIY